MVIYLDYNATTPVDNQVLETMLPYFSQKFGNAASSTHQFGWIAKEAVDHARLQIANALNCVEQEIVFTSGATESINTVLKGIYNLYQTKGKHIITFKTEHKAVLDTCNFLEKKGAEITYLNVDKNGKINLEEFDKSIRTDTILVAIMLANNETGVLQDIKAISNIVHQHQSILFCDATQAFGKIKIDVNLMEIDALCISAHKTYGPKGVGALYLRRRNPRVNLEPLFHGGHHERGFRSGTLNVPGIVGLGKASEIAYQHLDGHQKHILELQYFLETELQNIFDNKLEIVSKNGQRLYNTSSIIFPMRAEQIIREIKHKIAVSTGSACSSMDNKPSHVLMAMGYTKEQALSSIRFSLGVPTTRQEIQETIEIFKRLA